MPPTLKKWSHEVVGYLLFQEVLGIPEIANVCMTHAMDTKCMNSEAILRTILKNHFERKAARQFFANGHQLDDYETLVNIIDGGYASPKQPQTVQEYIEDAIRFYGAEKVDVAKFHRVIARQKSIEKRFGINIDDIIDTSKVLSDEEFAVLDSNQQTSDKNAGDMSERKPIITVFDLLDCFNSAMEMPLEQLRANTPTYEELLGTAWEKLYPEQAKKLIKADIARSNQNQTK